nr:hypothetical protein [Rhodococcus wratislaviensis]GLK41227.1 hypothetical protein GCM10017611_81030 [Rhodococcus wratislaviensis]
MAPRTPEEIVEQYTPRMPAQEWEEIAPFVRDVVQRGFSPSRNSRQWLNRISTVTSMVAWAVEQGLPLEVEQIFHPATVNRYAVTVPGLADATRSCRRSALTALSRRITRVAPWEPPRQALPHSPVSRPYTSEQVETLLWWVPRQASVVRRQGLAAAVALGVGAGLAGAEMVNVGAADVRVRGEHVIVTVSGRRARQVPVRPAYREAVLASAEQAGRGHLFRDPVPRVEFVGEVLEHCDLPPGLRPVTSSRLRCTWVLAMLQTVPLPVFRDLSGVGERQIVALSRSLERRPRRAWTAAELDALAKAVPW